MDHRAHNTIHLFMSCQVGHSPPATIVNRVISRLQGFTNVLVGFVSVQRSPLQFDNFPSSSSTSTTPPAQTMDYYYRSLVPLSLPLSIVPTDTTNHMSVICACPSGAETSQLDDLPEQAKQFSRLVIRLASPTNYLSALYCGWRRRLQGPSSEAAAAVEKCLGGGGGEIKVVHVNSAMMMMM